MTASEGATPNNDPELPLEIDMTRPTIARVYDALLGGKNNFPPDREGTRTYLEYVPDADRCAVENREALVRGVQYLAHTAGINQFLDIGSGLPTVKNTHEAAQEINPDARIVYIDNDDRLDEHDIAKLITAYRDGATASLAAAHNLSLKSVKRLRRIAGLRRTPPTRQSERAMPTTTHP